VARWGPCAGARTGAVQSGLRDSAATAMSVTGCGAQLPVLLEEDTKGTECGSVRRTRVLLSLLLMTRQPQAGGHARGPKRNLIRLPMCATEQQIVFGGHTKASWVNGPGCSCDMDGSSLCHGSLL
jgi:hypothetical protein